MADVSLVIWSLIGVIETAQIAAPEAWRRALDVFLAGLRPSETALSQPPPTPAEMSEVIKQRA